MNSEEISEFSGDFLTIEIWKKYIDLNIPNRINAKIKPPYESA